MAPPFLKPAARGEQSVSMIHLRSVAVVEGKRGDGFPFSVPTIRTLNEVTFEAPVTFFVGENGSGKSTLLESLAIASGVPAVAATGARDDETLAAQRRLASALRLAWASRTHKGFFLRAEDFFGFAKLLSRSRDEMRHRLAELEVEYRDRSPYARGLAEGPARASLAEMEKRYGVDLDANSHGQAFFQLFRSRFVPGGLYLLDEPETPLSPLSQLAFIAMLKDMVAQDAQFIIATHSPILLALPGAQILDFDQQPVRSASYADLEHVRLTREFLANPDLFLRRL
ncbi:MAG: AAA family ATPase [Bryobacteraceae bacterium]